MNDLQQERPAVITEEMLNPLMPDGNRNATHT